MSQWITRWGIEVSSAPVLPGVWKRKAGGHVVRGSAKDPRTGKLVQIWRVHRNLSAREALAWLETEKARTRVQGAGAKACTPRFHEFAASLFQRKVTEGDIQSAAGREKWAGALEHILRAPFADFYVDRIRVADVLAWRSTLPGLEWKRGKYNPRTLNTWLSILRVILKAAVVEHELPRDPMLGVEDFPTRDPYTQEQPNALSPEEGEVSAFLEHLRARYPQHFAMVFLGLVLGQRPSTLRPLRRHGTDADLKFNADGTARLLIRRSNSRGQEIMNRTKTGRVDELPLDHVVVDVLQWHMARLDEDPITRVSNLLFPSPVTGELRSRSSLDKPFAEACRLAKITKHITPKAMRRTFQDMSRAAGISAVVAKAISGHATDAMHVHYSTAHAPELSAAMAKVVSLTQIREAKASGKGH